jgi:hypothetical protein
MDDQEKTLDIILKYGLDQSALNNTKAGVKNTTSALEKQEQQLRKNRMELRELSQVFSFIGLTGAAVYVPAIAASQEYIKQFGKTEEASRRWLAAQDSIKQSTIEIGRVVTEGLLPGFEKAAQVAQQFAAWADKNPKAVQAAVGIAGGLVALAAAGKIFTEVDRAIVDIQLIAAGLMKKAADEQLAAATYGVSGGLIGPAEKAGAGAAGVLGYIGSIAGGVAIGVAVYDQIAKKYGLQKGADIIGQWVTIGATAAATPIASLVGGIAGLFNGRGFGGGAVEGVAGVWNFVGKGLGTVNDGKGGNTQNPASQPTWFNDGLAAFTDYQKSLIDNQKKYDDEMKANDDQANAQILAINDAFNKARERQDRDHAQSELRTLEDFQLNQDQSARNFMQQSQQEEAAYYQSRMQAAQQYGIDAARAEQDHQIQMQRLAEDHNDRASDLIANRDAMGLMLENRSYEKQRNRDEEDYNKAAGRRYQDYARQMADMEKNFAQQRAQRLADYEQQQADAQSSFDRAKQRRDADYQQQQADADADKISQENAIIKAHNDKMDQLSNDLQAENDLQHSAFISRMNDLQNIVTATEAAMIANYTAFLRSLPNIYGGVGNTPYGPPAPTNTKGLSPSTTNSAASIVNGRMAQQNLIAAMVSGRSGGSTGGHVFHFSGMTAQNIGFIMDRVEAVLDNRLAEAFKQ